MIPNIHPFGWILRAAVAGERIFVFFLREPACIEKKTLAGGGEDGAHPLP